MTKLKKNKIITVREHPRRVPITLKNPQGITVVDRHSRKLKGTYLDPAQIQDIFRTYSRGKIIFPTSKDLGFKKDGNRYDEIIAVWTDYFSKKFNADPPMDPDVVKALIASESGFQKDPPGNKVAIGIAQITKPTLTAIQDPRGEVKEFIFENIRQKDLLEPEISIPVAIRWLFRKKETARAKLNREPSNEELILEYKGLLKSKTSYKDNALESFRRNYAQLKKK